MQVVLVSYVYSHTPRICNHTLGNTPPLKLPRQGKLATTEAHTDPRLHQPRGVTCHVWLPAHSALARQTMCPWSNCKGDQGMTIDIYQVIPQMSRWMFDEHGLPNTCSLDFRKANIEMLEQLICIETNVYMPWEKKTKRKYTKIIIGNTFFE